MRSNVREAEEFGIDISLLIENLKLTPTQRLQKLQNQIRFHDELRTARNPRAERSGSRKTHKSSRQT
jgi:hypothetical protein